MRSTDGDIGVERIVAEEAKQWDRTMWGVCLSVEGDIGYCTFPGRGYFEG